MSRRRRRSARPITGSTPSRSRDACDCSGVGDLREDASHRLEARLELLVPSRLFPRRPAPYRHSTPASRVAPVRQMVPAGGRMRRIVALDDETKPFRRSTRDLAAGRAMEHEARRRIEDVEHPPRDPYLDDPNLRICVPVGERRLLLPSEEEVTSIHPALGIDGAVPPDAPAVRDHDQRVVSPCRVGQRTKWTIIDLLNGERLAADDRLVSVQIVWMVNEQVAPLRAMQVDDELETHRGPGS